MNPTQRERQHPGDAGIADRPQDLMQLWIDAPAGRPCVASEIAAAPLASTGRETDKGTRLNLSEKEAVLVKQLMEKAHQAYRAGKVDRMAECLEEVVSIAPKHANAQYNLGIAYRDLGQIFDAERALRRAVQADPTMVDAFQALADLLFGAKHLMAALGYYEKALELAPNRIPVLHHMAKSRLMMKQAEDVETLCRRILLIDHQSCDAHWQLAWSLSSQNKSLHEALDAVEKGMSLEPENGHCHAIRQRLLEQLGETDKAGEAWENVRAIAERDWRPHKQICEMYHWLGQTDKARAISLAYVERNPNDVEAFRELSTIMMADGDFVSSQELLDKGLQIAPDNQILRMVKGLNSFRIGRYREGLELYGARWGRDSHDKPWDIPAPSWDGRRLAEKSLVVHSEQGIGDYVMFGLLFSELRSLAKSIVIEVNVRMHRLFQRTYPGFGLVDRQFLPANWDSARVGAKASMGDLPLLLDADMENLPNRGGFLVPDSNLAVALRKKYQALYPGKRLVGISWRSGSRDSATIRSIDLALLEPVLRDPNCGFVSLQYGDNTRDLNDLQRRTGISIHWDRDIDPMGDMDPFAAQVAAMDLVISVDNSTVHFAGALGKPCWVMLPVNSDWRWLMDRPKSIWYDSLELFRLKNGQGWEDIIQPVAERLASVDDRALEDATATMCRRCAEAMLKVGRYSDAEGFLRWLIEMGRDLGFAMHGMGIVAQSVGKAGDAAGILARAVELEPDRIDYRADFALALQHAGEPDAAYRMARDLTRQSDDPAALKAMANILIARGQADQASDFIARILQSKPDDVDARFRLALLQFRQDEDDLARKNALKALDVDPDHAPTRTLLGEIMLRHGERSLGASNFAYRFGGPPDRLPARLDDMALDDRPMPWTQRKLKRKRLYLLPERDLLEQLLFMPRLSALADECSSIVAECDRRLMPILIKAFPEVRFAPAGSLAAKDLVETGVQSFGSLGDIQLARPAAQRPGSQAWLAMEPEEVRRLKAEYGAALPGRQLVGLCWRSASRLASGNDVKLPLETFAALFDDPRIGVVSVHPGNVREELDQFVARSGAALIFDDRIQQSADLAMLAAQLAALDAVLSVDDLVLALATALGKIAIKIAATGEHWSWGFGASVSEWWPGTDIVRGAGLADFGVAEAHARLRATLGLKS